MTWLDSTLQDLQYAIRMLRKSPGFTAIAIGTIALGIGANTAIFSVVHSVLLNQLPYRDPDRLVTLSEKDLAAPGLDRISFPTARAFLRRSRTIERIALYGDGGGGRLFENGEAEQLRGQNVSPDFFDTLGVRPQLGRTFVPEDSLPGRDDVIILSDALWKRRFAGNPAIVGRAVEINSRPIRVIGVLPADFHALHMSNPGEVPQTFRVTRIKDLESEDYRYGLTDIARLKPGVTVGQARAELNTILRNLVSEHPNNYSSHATVNVEPLYDKLTGRMRTALWVLAGAVGFVLLITCVNVANLLLTRASERTTEITVRAALGCGRWRLVRQLLTESLLLSVLGGLGGVMLAWRATASLVAFAPTEIPRVDEIRMDAPVLIFAFLATLLAGVLFGLAPALHAWRLDLNDALRAGRDPGAIRSARMRKTLVIAEIAAAFVLAIGAGLLGRSLDKLLHVDAGYDPHNILTLTAFAHDSEDVLQYYRNLVERIRVLPGVESAAMVSTVPLSQPVRAGLFIEGRPFSKDAEAPRVDLCYATPDYFRLMRIPLKRGRVFGDGDRLKDPPVALISESCARSQFPAEDPIGRRIRFDGSDGDGSTAWATVIGVVGDVWQHGMDDGPSAGVYMPQSQHPGFYYRLLARTAGDPWSIFPSVRAALRELNPREPLFHVQPMDAYVTKSLADRIFTLSLVGLLGALALTLAAVGIYGVVSYAVSLRTREVGIRIALGAGRGDVLRLVMRDLLAMLGWGLAAGFLSALALTRFLAHLLYQVQPTDLVTTATAALGLACVALGAGYVPCRHATRISPSAALRHD